MGAELEAAATVAPEDRHRAGIAYPNPLAGNPAGDPTFARTVKRADGSDLKVACPTATRLAIACMDMNAVLGGAACHWGGPSAFAEVMSAIHGILFSSDDHREAFNFANDAGHCENGIYALKANYGQAGLDFEALKGFRSMGSPLTGHGESHLFAEGVMVSNGPLGSSLPIAQGLAAGDCLADKDRVTICAISDGAMMEGEAKEACAAIPGLAAAGKLAPFVMAVSDNNTKLSGRIDADAFSMKPSFQALDDLGWNVIDVADGHDLQAVFTAVESAVASAKADPTKPVAIWLHTIKGKGVKKTEESSSGGHGYPLKKGTEVRAFCDEILADGHGADTPMPKVFADWIAELEQAQADADAAAAAKAGAPKPAAGKIQGGFPKAMIAAADKGLPVVSVSADLQGSTGVAPFRSKYPQLSFEVGVAESNMVSMAGGLSKQGYIPVVDTFAQFGVTKGALPLCMATLSQSPIIACFTHTGFQDAADGASHQALMYLAMSGAIPHVVTYCPSSAEEAEWAMGEAIARFAADREAGKTPDSVLFFCGRENFPVSLKADDASYEWGKALVVADTTEGKASSVTISANGAMVLHAIKASEALAADGIGAIVLSNSMANQPDVEAHQAALAKTGGKLVTVEDHQAIGGAGAMLTTALKRAGSEFSLALLGVEQDFGRSAYNAPELYDHYGIGANGITAAAKSLV